MPWAVRRVNGKAGQSSAAMRIQRASIIHSAQGDIHRGVETVDKPHV